MPELNSFISAVRARLNRHRALVTFLWAFAVGAAVLLAIAAVFIFRGYAVPRFWYPVIAVAALIGGGFAARLRRRSEADAALVADEHFHLSDHVISARRFEKEQRTGGFYERQAESTRQLLSKLDPAALPTPLPRRLAATAGVLVLCAALTAFKSPSPAVLKRLAQEELTGQQTKELVERLKEELKELEKATDDPEERKALDEAKLKELVDKLQATKDLKEALREFAKAERLLNEAAAKLDQRKDEHTAAKAGEELQKEEDPQARELGKKLKEADYKQAAKDLEKLKTDANNEKGEPKKLSEQRKELAKLKSAAMRMAAAAKSQQQGRKDGQSKPGQNGQPSKSMSPSGQDGDPSLEDLMAQLDQDAKEADQSLENAERLEKLGKLEKSESEKCDKNNGKCASSLIKLGDKLKKMGAAKSAGMKLAELSKKLSQCQGMLAGQCQSPFAAKGGKKPGVGTEDSRREAKESIVDNGQTTQLTGQKNGQGPVQTQIESADEGTGVSNRHGEAKERAFKKQFESFVNREDVPAGVKSGVKNYFDAIHEGAKEEPKEEVKDPAKP